MIAQFHDDHYHVRMCVHLKLTRPNEIIKNLGDVLELCSHFAAINKITPKTTAAKFEFLMHFGSSSASHNSCWL